MKLSYRGWLAASIKMRTTLIALFLASGSFFVAVPSVAGAQGSLFDQTRGDAAPARAISINPFLPLMGYFQGEYEQSISDNVAFALAGSYMRFDDYYTNVDVKLRLYPQEDGLRGLGIAGGLGYGAVRRSGEVCDDFGINCQKDNTKRSAPTFSVEAHYQLLLGSTRATAVAAGFGVKRYFLSEEDSKGVQRVLPTMRLTIGYAF